MALIHKIYRKLFSREQLPTKIETDLDFVRVGKGTRLDGMSASIRMGDKENRIIVGENSVVSGVFVLEKETGTITVGDRTFIGAGCQFIAIDGISIGNDVMFSWGCTVMDNNAHSLKWEDRKNDVLDWKKGLDDDKIGCYKDWSNVRHAKVVIKDKAWIGFDVKILKGVTIGERSVVAAGSVVTIDVPNDCVVAGNPAKVIKEIEQ